jgi:hypothetical protein
MPDEVLLSIAGYVLQQRARSQARFEIVSSCCCSRLFAPSCPLHKTSVHVLRSASSSRRCNMYKWMCHSGSPCWRRFCLIILTSKNVVSHSRVCANSMSTPGLCDVYINGFVHPVLALGGGSMRPCAAAKRGQRRHRRHMCCCLLLQWMIAEMRRREGHFMMSPCLSFGCSKSGFIAHCSVRRRVIIPARRRCADIRQHRSFGR